MFILLVMRMLKRESEASMSMHDKIDLKRLYLYSNLEGVGGSEGFPLPCGDVSLVVVSDKLNTCRSHLNLSTSLVGRQVEC